MEQISASEDQWEAYQNSRKSARITVIRCSLLLYVIASPDRSIVPSAARDLSPSIAVIDAEGKRTTESQKSEDTDALEAGYKILSETRDLRPALQLPEMQAQMSLPQSSREVQPPSSDRLLNDHDLDLPSC